MQNELELAYLLFAIVLLLIVSLAFRKPQRR